MRTSQRGINLIKEFEGLKATCCQSSSHRAYGWPLATCCSWYGAPSKQESAN